MAAFYVVNHGLAAGAAFRRQERARRARGWIFMTSVLSLRVPTRWLAVTGVSTADACTTRDGWFEDGPSAVTYHLLE